MTKFEDEYLCFPPQRIECGRCDGKGSHPGAGPWPNRVCCETCDGKGYAFVSAPTSPESAPIEKNPGSLSPKTHRAMDDLEHEDNDY